MKDAIATAYRSAFESVLIVRHEQPGVIELRGADRVDLLNRLSTNDLENLPADRVMKTVFTDPIGRTIDVVSVLTLSDRLLIVTSNGRAGVMRDWLVRHIFFQDDVSVQVLEDEWKLYGAYGPKAIELLPTAAPPTGNLNNGKPGILWPTDLPVSGFMRLVGPDHSSEDWQVKEHADSAFEILRLEAGLPKIGSEILDDTIPLEVGLWDAVSFEKGCYVGQEIIARLESRGRLAKKLVGVRLESRAEPGEVLSQGGIAVGNLTSTVHSPRFGWIGLASVRPKKLAETDGRVSVGEKADPAHIIELPFSEVEAPAPR